MLEFLKLWGCRKKNVGVQEEEASTNSNYSQAQPISPTTPLSPTSSSHSL